MASFAYKGRNIDGGLVDGIIDAANLDAAADTLLGSRITPIELKLAEDDVLGGRSLKQILIQDKITSIELITFSRQMYNLTKAGLPLDRAIRGLEASLSNPAMRRVLKSVIQSLERGNTLSEGMSQHPKVFNDLFLSLVRVGENTGRLDLAFQDLGRYMEIERNTDKQLKSATRYPMFVLMAMAGAIGGGHGVCDPRVFGRVFQDGRRFALANKGADCDLGFCPQFLASDFKFDRDRLR